MKLVKPLTVSFLIVVAFASCSNEISIAEPAIEIPVLETPTLASASTLGAYNVAILFEEDGLRNGADYAGATLYYPTDATPPFASIVIVPGFSAGQSSIEDWGPFYASHGIVAMTIGTNSVWEFPESRAAALLDALETLRQENTRENSALNGKLDLSKFAVSGWSMGGGGAQIAATLDGSIQAVIALCPWLSSPTEATLNHATPVLIFSGQEDTVAVPEEHARIQYELTPVSTRKLLFEVAGGGHYSANSPEESNGEIGRVGLSWLMTQLDINSNYRPLLFEVPEASSLYETNLIE